MAARQGGGRGVGPETGRNRRSGWRREVAGLETGRGNEFLGRGVKEKEMGWGRKKLGRFGLKWRKRKRKLLYFLKRFKLFQFKFKPKDSNLN